MALSAIRPGFEISSKEEGGRREGGKEGEVDG